MKRRGWDKKHTYNEYTHFSITVNTLFQVRLSLIVIPCLIRRHPELDLGQNEYTLIQVRHSQIVIPDLIREPE